MTVNVNINSGGVQNDRSHCALNMCRTLTVVVSRMTEVTVHLTCVEH